MYEFLNAPAPQSNALHKHVWHSVTVVCESSLDRRGPPTSTMIAKKALANLKRQKSNDLRIWEAAHLQIALDVIRDAIDTKMYELGLDGTAEYAYCINLDKVMICEFGAIEATVFATRESLL